MIKYMTFNNYSNFYNILFSEILSKIRGLYRDHGFYTPTD